MLYANVEGEKRRAERGLIGTCPSCDGSVIAKCGSIVIHHWAHAVGAGCDPWSESVGPWHLEWQDLVRPEFVEVVLKPHKADILGDGSVVVELQHSPISPDEIAEREQFYGNMVWVFDATERFEMVPVGQRTFFTFRRTQHPLTCSKPVFLDFGSVLVEVESFTSAVAHFNGFGRTRTRSWFVKHFLQGRLKAGAAPTESMKPAETRWYKKLRYDKTRRPTRWHDPKRGGILTLPQGTLCLPLSWYETGYPRVYEWERVIDQHPEVANGWSKMELATMKRLFSGTPMILDGLLRLMPAAPAEMDGDMDMRAVRCNLVQADGHVAGGRVPEIDAETKAALIARSEVMDVQLYGRICDDPEPPPKLGGDDGQKGLFGE